MRHLVLMAAAAGALVLGSCGDNSTRRADAGGAVSNFVIDETIKTASQSYVTVVDGDTTYMSISVSLMWPEKLGDSSLSTLQDSIISAMFPGVNTSRGIDGAIRHFVSDASVFDYGEFAPIDSIPSSRAAGMAWYIDMTGKFAELNEQMATYQVTTASYSGGAHPNTVTRFFTYDLANATVLTPGNMFKKGSETALLGIIRESLAVQLGTTVDKLDDAGIFVGQLTGIGDPYLTQDAVVFHYNPYEIAPYSMGAVDVTVWAEELGDYLTPQVLELINR